MNHHDALQPREDRPLLPGRHCRILLLVFTWLVMGHGTPTLASEPTRNAGESLPVHGTMVGDAAITTIFFINQQAGWAVGERGVIWHTRDGGATWVQQATPVRCRINSVFFLDEQQGWAAGGAGQPFAHTSSGVVLRTEDGGNTWAEAPNLRLPMLTRVKCFDHEHGVAIGIGSSSAPSGVFATRDGGRSWQPHPANASGQWLAGDFLDPNRGAVAGMAGAFATVVDRQVTHSPLASRSLRSMRDMRLVPPTGGWLVGDGGLVMTTRDLGHSWQSPPVDLPQDVADHFDFHAVAVHGSNVWIAGSPGTRVFHSPDGGQSWQALATGHHAPIRSITFVDAQRGWAAGEMGTVLHTADGGHTWQVQRAGGQRAALLAIMARAGDMPLELIAEQAAEEGYLSAIEILLATPPTGATLTSFSQNMRTREAMVLAGATDANTAWRFPLAENEVPISPPDLIATLNRVNDGLAMERLENHLVRQVRMWRPAVVVTHHAQSAEGEPISTLVEQLALRAIAAAADPLQHLASSAGLDAWQVSKVYGVLPLGTRGDETIATGRFAPRLGGTLADWAAPAQRLLQDGYAASPDTYQLVLLKDFTERSSVSRGLFAGIALSPGGEARRPTANLPVENIEELRRLAQRRHHLRELLKRTEGNAAWVGQVMNLTEGLSAAAGGELLYQLAEGYRAAGRLDLAADTYYLLARRWPDHPLSDRAVVWLVQFYASGEAACRLAGPRPEDVRQTTTTSPDENESVEHVGGTSVLDPARPAVGLSRDDRLRRAVQLGEYLEAARPELFTEPAVRFPIVAAQRQLGFANPASRYFLTLRQLPADDLWRRSAETEEWLANPKELPPTKLFGACRTVDKRPHLDGKLDEPFWEAADGLKLKDTQNALGTARLAYDQQFLYLALECPKATGLDYTTDDQSRSRDADLSQNDRVTMRFDIDRDYTTHFELVVDHRGWTHDACWGDASWNPTWYVASASDDVSWTVEAAIPLANLTSDPPATRHVWAVSIRRDIPRFGSASWAGAINDSPDTFGMLLFE